MRFSTRSCMDRRPHSQTPSGFTEVAIVVEYVEVIECLKCKSCKRKLVEMNDGQQHTLYISPKGQSMLMSAFYLGDI